MADDADGADQLAGAGPDRREPGRGRPGQGPQGGRGELAGQAGRADASSWPRPSWHRSRKQAEQTVVTAEAESRAARSWPAAAKAAASLQVGLSEAAVLLRKIQSFGDPRLYALSHGGRAPVAQQPAAGARAGVHGRRPTATRRTATATADAAGQGLLRPAAQPAGRREVRLPAPPTPEGSPSLEEFADRMTREAMEVLPEPAKA